MSLEGPYVYISVKSSAFCKKLQPKNILHATLGHIVVYKSTCHKTKKTNVLNKF